MSKRTQEERRARSERDPLVHRTRLAGLFVVIALQLACVIGARGPWWQAMFRGQPFGDPTVGPGDPWSGVIIIAALAGLFFASYDLVAGEDIQLPILLTTLVLLGAAGKVFHRVYWSEETIHSIAREVGEARALGVIPRDEPPPAPTAPVGSAEPNSSVVGPVEVIQGDPARPNPDDVSDDVLLSGALSLRFSWGLALILSAAPLLVLVSAALTFIARKGSPEPST